MLKEKHLGCAPLATDKVTRIDPARNSFCTAPIAQSIGCNSLDFDIRRPKRFTSEKDGPQEEEPDFGGDGQEKPQENEGSKDSSTHPDVTGTNMQPRENILVARGATSEGEAAADLLILP